MIELFAPIALKIFGFIVDKYVTDNEIKKKFYEFNDALARKATFSVRLQKTAQEQMERLKQK